MDLVDKSGKVLIRREERFAKTAVGWILREISRTNDDYVKEFLKNNLEYFTVETIKNSDRVIIPAFSVGRSQEILTILEKNGLLAEKNVFVPGLAGETAKLVGVKGKYLTGKFNTDNFSSGTIVVSGGGMLQGGIARELLDQTKDDKNTSVILCGYQAPGTLGYCLREKYG